MRQSNTHSDLPGQHRRPGLFRRLAAITYDSFLLAAVLFVATAAILPFNSGNAFRSDQYFYPAYLAGVGFLFFGWFWTHGGQTLGMRAWKIQVATIDGKPIGWTHAGLRFIAAILSWLVLGFGFWWIVFDKKKRGWHDALSKTEIRYESGSPGTALAPPPP